MTDIFDGAEDPIGADSKIPKDQWGRYKLPHPLTGTVAGRTRVTTFAKSISDTYVLSQWSQRMVAKGLTVRPDLLTLAAATPLDDRETLNRITEDAKEAASAKHAANMGTAMHAFAETLDRRTPGQPIDHVPTWDTWPVEVRRDLAARDRALIDHQITMVPTMIERVVYVPEFDVAGTFDRWGYVDDKLPQLRSDGLARTGEIIDDKTGRDLTYGQTEIAIQLACYANASHVWSYWTASWEPMPPTRKDRAIVIHMPVGKATITVYEVDIAEGWAAAQLCADVRAWRKRRNLFTTLAIATLPAEPANRREEIAERLAEAPDAITEAITREPTWAERIEAASSRGDLSRIWREAARKGQWTPELEKLGKVQLSKFTTA